MNELYEGAKENCSANVQNAVNEAWTYEEKVAFFHNQLCTGLVHELSKYKGWELEADIKHELKLDMMTLNTMPLITVAVCAAPLFNFQNWAAHELWDPKKLPKKLYLLKGLAKEWLSKANDDHRIAGALKSLHQDNVKCAAVAELMILNKIYPSHNEILFCQTGYTMLRLELGTGHGHVRRLDMYDEEDLGLKPSLTTAMDMLLEFVDLDLSKRSKSTSHPLDPTHPYMMRPSSYYEASTRLSEMSAEAKKAYAQLIWNFMGLDEESVLSEDQSRKLCCLMVSRASLGRLLITSMRMSCSDPDDSMMTTPLGRASLISVIPSVVLSFIQEDIESACDNLWLHMNERKNGKLCNQEFCERFLSSFWKAVVSPLTQRLAKKGKAAWEENLTKIEGVLATNPLSQMAPPISTPSYTSNIGTGFTPSCLPENDDSPVAHIVSIEYGKPSWSLAAKVPSLKTLQEESKCSTTDGSEDYRTVNDEFLSDEKSQPDSPFGLKDTRLAHLVKDRQKHLLNPIFDAAVSERQPCCGKQHCADSACSVM